MTTAHSRPPRPSRPPYAKGKHRKDRPTPKTPAYGDKRHYARVGLTPLEVKTLEIMYRHRVETGTWPTLTAVAKRLGVALPIIVARYRNLTAKGAIARRVRSKYNMRMLHPAFMEGRPMLVEGTVPGKPVDEHERWHPETERHNFHEAFVMNESGYALEVDGDDMAAGGIVNGDLLFIDHDARYKSGDTVVIVVENAAYVKKIFRHAPGVLRLESEGAPEMIVNESEIQIRGVVRSMFRRL